MTAQVPDTIKFEGRTYPLASEPLAFWLERRKNRHLRFRRINTAIARGYRSTWEVAMGRLYLTEFTAMLVDGSPATIDSLFENYSSQYLDSVTAHDLANAGPGRFAFWLTAALRCPFGELVQYNHFGYDNVYDSELILYFRAGFLVGQRIINHERRTPTVLREEDVLTELELQEELAYRSDLHARRNKAARTSAPGGARRL
jgi:hypothetical protein